MTSPRFSLRGGSVHDVEIMEANGLGMDAYDDGMSIHDNPYQHPALRDAWHQGWQSAQRNDPS
jgi:ribosome modulation factor